MKKRFLDRLDALRGVEHGFTLMELLVAMVVLSILMATASQYYLHQRRKGWEAQVRASVRNMAGAQNYFVYTEGGSTFTHDLDDLYFVGYRWNDKSLRPYVALATPQTFCVQVHSANDPSIVWHFSSDVGHPRPGPATPIDCGDPEVMGLYLAGLPDENVGRDGQLSGGGASTGEWVASLPPGSTTSGPDGESSIEEGEFGPGGFGTGGTGTGGIDDSTTTGSTPSYGTGDTTNGTGSGDTAGGTGSGATTGGSTSAGCTGGGTGSGSTTGINHPSGNSRDSEGDGSGSQGSSGSDPDGDENGGADKPGEGGGANTGDQDGNNGSGNDTDFEDDNEGPDRDGTPTPGTRC